MEDMDLVVLVDQNGKDLRDLNGKTCTLDKMQAHVKGVLHRAVSVFIFNHRNELLLQKRASNKYHTPGKWSNTCCTHPRLGESPLETAHRRLKEEMGLDCELTEEFSFLYKAEVGNDLIENEYDHVFTGYSNDNPTPDFSEVSDWKWDSLKNVREELNNNPDKFTAWFRLCFPEIIRYKFSHLSK